MLPEYVKAIDPNTPVSELELLSLHDNPCVPEGVCYNSSTPASILESCALHSDLRVICAVATHANTPEAILLNLANHSEWCVRYNIVARKALLPVSVQKKLVRDPNPNVRQGLAARFVVDSDVLDTLTRDPNSEVAGAAASPRVDPETIKPPEMPVMPPI
jgi:hypothetical protein